MKNELADLIAFEIANMESGGLVRPSADGKTPVFESDERIAAAILAAGYRKPRTISTTEELDALPLESVVKASDGNVWESLVGGWFETASRVRNESSSVRLPATVLYEPEPRP